MSWQDKALAAFWADAFANEPLDSHRRIEAAIAAAAASLLPSKDAPMTDHPITPPPELVEQWLAHAPNPLDRLGHVAAQAARWGADQELGACCADLRMAFGPAQADWLRSVRRPKPPTLAERALDAQRRMWDGGSSHADWELIRAALERLQELENN